MCVLRREGCEMSYDGCCSWIWKGQKHVACAALSPMTPYLTTWSLSLWCWVTTKPSGPRVSPSHSAGLQGSMEAYRGFNADAQVWFLLLMLAWKAPWQMESSLSLSTLHLFLPNVSKKNSWCSNPAVTSRGDLAIPCGFELPCNFIFPGRSFLHMNRAKVTDIPLPLWG